MKKEIGVNGLVINLRREKGDEYISLTDIARKKNPLEPKDVVKNWLRSKSTIEFLALWEKINNPDFKKLAELYGSSMKGKSWIDNIQSAYEDSNKNEYISIVNNLLKNLYPSANIKVNDDDFKDASTFNKKIAAGIANEYLKDQDLLFINSETNDYIYIRGYEEYVNKIYDGTLFVKKASDKVPRIFY